MTGFEGIKRTDSGKGSCLALSGELTVQSSAEFKAVLVGSFDGVTCVTLDTAGVTDVDLTGLQLLCAAHRHANASGMVLNVTGVRTGGMAAVAENAGFSRQGQCSLNMAECLLLGGGD